MRALLLMALTVSTLVHPAVARDQTQELADTTRANQYSANAKDFAEKAQYDSAIVYLQKAGIIYEKSEQWESYVRCLNKIGGNYWQKGEFDNALEWLGQAKGIGLQRLGEKHPEVASSYHSIGAVYWRKGKYDQALEYLKKGLDIRLATLGEQHIQVASSYNSIGLVYVSIGELDKALAFHQKALDIRLGELGEQHLEVATSYQNIGIVYWKRAENDRALDLFQKALEIRKAILGEQHPLIANSYNTIGAVYWNKGELRNALKFFQKSLDVRKATLGDGHFVLAESYNNVGLIYKRMGDSNRALELYEKALDIRLRTFGEQHPDVATSYNNIGSLYWDKGDYERALEFHQKALAIKLNVLGEQHIEVARSYLNLGRVYYKKGDYERAIEFHQKALNIRLSAFGEQHPDVVASYNDLASVYLQKGEYEQALEYHQKGLRVKLAVLGEQHPSVAGTYNNIGEVYVHTKDYDRALDFFQKSLKIRLNTEGPKHLDVAESYNNIGVTYYEKGDFDRALQFQRKALPIRLATQGEHHPEVAQTYYVCGNAYLGKSDFERALHSYQESLQANVPGFAESDPYSNPSLSNVLSEQELLRTLQGKAEVLIQRHTASGNLQDLQAAFSTAKLMVQLLDRMRSGFQAEGSKLLLAEKASTIFEKAIRAALGLSRLTGDSQYEAQAFGFAEKAKAAVLWEALQDSHAKQFAGIPDSLLDKERQLRIDLASYDTRIQEEELKLDKRDSLLINDFENRYFDLNRRYEKLIARFESDYPRYYTLKYQTRGLTVAELQKRIDDRTSVLEFFTGDSAIYVFTISKSDFEVTRVPRDSLLENQIEQLRLGITKNRGDGDYRLYTRTAHQLYQKLFLPVAPRLHTQKLVIIPDGILNTLPFETLLSAEVAAAETIDYKSLPYLMKKYDLSYAYSANLLWATAGQPKPPPYDYLAFAPVFSSGLPDESRGMQLVKNNHALDSTRAASRIYLPASKQEVLGIRELFQKSHGLVARLSDWLLEKKTRVYLEQDANEENLKKQPLKNYRYLHFATHGFANKDAPDLSGLLLAQDSASVEDGVLHLPEIYTLDLNADLVVVSACESGAGKLAKGEGLIGLTRGFLYAGARNLLVSLWKVNDWSTADLMLGFYSRILQGNSKAAALRQAKLQLMQDRPDYAKPYYWAPFILIGR